MKKATTSFIIFFIIFLICLSSVSAFGESNTLYEMEEEYIDLTKISIEISEDGKYIPFDSAISNLESEMKTTGETGAGKTSVYFEDDKDKKENILRVDLDFAGETLVQPVNTMFVTDQSGSMNMTAGQASGSVSTTPCLHNDHVYKIRVKIDSKYYSYYHSPGESNWTGDWLDAVGKEYILEEIKNHAIEEGVATEISKVGLVYGNFYLHSNGNRPSNFHYDYTGNVNFKNAQRLYVEKPISEEEVQKAEIEKNFFTKIENDTFDNIAPTTTWEFYSPADINTDITAAAYVEGLNEGSACYDRMNISKSVFHELSEIALSNPGNYIGFANFAGELYGSQSLGTNPLNETFLNTMGRQNTHYEDGLDFAKNEFTKTGETHSDNQNLLIFVTDGVPNGSKLDSEAEMIAYMKDFVEETGAIVYFIGIDIPSENYGKWGPLIATTDSYGKENMRNSQNVQDLLSIQEELKKILTSTTNIETSIKSDFYMVVDSQHPVTITYTLKDSKVVHSKTVDSIEDLTHLGITYDKTSGSVSWDAGSQGVTSARLTFYKEFDDLKVDWEKIKEGQTLTGISLGASTTGYIDYSGREKEITMDETASYVIEKNSKLTIKNTTSTPYDVEVGDVINYQIQINNTGTLSSDNNFIYQEIPQGSTFYECSEAGEYDSDEELIKFAVPELNSGETLVYNYSTIATEYDTEIVSQAKLGVEGEPVTLYEEGIPILTAEDLHHKTPSEEESSSVGGNEDKEDEGGLLGGIIKTGDDSPLLLYTFIALVSFIITMILIIRKRIY